MEGVMRYLFIFCFLAIIGNVYAADQSEQHKSAILKGVFYLIAQESSALRCLVQIDHDSEFKVYDSWRRGLLQWQLYLSIPMHYFISQLMKCNDVLILKNVSLGKTDADDGGSAIRIDAQLTCKIKDIDKLVLNALSKDMQKKVVPDQLKCLQIK
jgi:hypothetical protein